MGTSFFFVHSFSRKSRLFYFGSVDGVLVVMCFRGLSGVWYWSEMAGSVSQSQFLPRFLFVVFFLFVWFLRSDDAPPPILFDFIFTLTSLLIPLFDHAQQVPVWKYGQVCVCVCVRARCCCCSSEDLHLDVSFTLYSTSCLCFSVFLCGLAPPALLCFCLLFFLLLLFLYDV